MQVISPFFAPGQCTKDVHLIMLDWSKRNKIEVYQDVNMIKLAAMLSVVRIVSTVVMLYLGPEECQAFLASRYIINPEASSD